MHDVHGSAVDEGLGAVLGQGAPQMDPEPVAEYDDMEHTEVMSADEVQKRLDYVKKINDRWRTSSST